jgi:fructose-1-phosphate kinase PfkB-like protein
MGFMGGFTGKSIEGMLLEEGLQIDFVKIAEETRTNVIINAPIPEGGDRNFDHRFNSAGPRVQPVESWELFEKIKALAGASAERRPTHVAICGSLARDMRPQYYSNLIRFFKDLGAQVYLDTSRGALKESLHYPPHPDLVKPNLLEFDELIENRLSDSLKQEPSFGRSTEESLERFAATTPCDSDERSSSASFKKSFWRTLEAEAAFFLSQHSGIKALLVTLGEAGMLLAKADGTMYHGRFAAPAGFTVVSTVGAGDSTLAGLIWALEDGKSWDEALRYAVAASAGAVTKAGTEAPTRTEVLQCLELVNIHAHNPSAHPLHVSGSSDVTQGDLRKVRPARKGRRRT